MSVNELGNDASGQPEESVSQGIYVNCGEKKKSLQVRLKNKDIEEMRGLLFRQSFNWVNSSHFKRKPYDPVINDSILSKQNSQYLTN